KRFLAELKRRNVFRVAAVYGVIGFAVIEVADAVFPRIPLPEWTVSLVVWLVLLGFPVGLVLAWAFETSPGGGVRRTRPVRPAILDAIVAQPAHRRWPIGLAGALGGALVVIGALWALGADWMPGGDGAPDRSSGALGGPSDSGPAVAVLPFRATGLASTDWGEGMVDMLSFNLDGVPGLRKVDPMTVMTASRARSDSLSEGAPFTPAGALSVAEAVGARYAVVGTALRPDEASDVRLAARVYDARTSELRGSVRVDGPADSLVRLVDDLTVEMLRQALVPVDGELPPVNLGRVTTSSLPALKAYLAGEERYRRGRYGEAVGHFQRAVELDSTFARALYRLAGAYGWEEEYGLARDYGERAARFADRLPERDSILVTLAARGHGMTDEFEEFVARYPDDADGWYRLGENRFHTQGVEFLPPSAYRDALERAVELAPHYWEPYLHLLEDAIARLERERVRELLRAYEAIDPDGTPCAGPRLVHDLRWGSDSVRERALAALDTVSRGMMSCANTGVAGAIPLLEEAERRTLSDPDGLSPYGLWQLPLRRLWNGQPSAARRVLAAAKNNPDLRAAVAGHEIAFHLAGYPGTEQEVRRAAELLREMPIVPPESPWFYRGFLVNRFWLGALALEEGREADLERATAAIAAIAAARRAEDPARADSAAAYGIALREFARLLGGHMERLDAFEAAMGIMSTFSTVAEYPAHYMRYAVGKLLFDRGDLSEAERYFRSVYPYAGPYFVPAQFYLGRIHEERGDADRAREHYLLFVRWWRDADPELQPWRERARDALRRLAPDSPTPAPG
ncbi:MAG: tetratricopeptide repeat protein, partial [Gemmatimonadota bacterium]